MESESQRDEAGMAMLLKIIKELEQSDIIEKELDDIYRFKQLMLPQCAKETILYSRRREYHEKIALWYEKYEEDISTIYSLLAYHWDKAENYEKAKEYSLKAAANVHYIS